MIRKSTGGTGRDDEDFYAFVRDNKVAYTFVLNVCSRTVEQNRTYLAKVAAKGHLIPRFEIGNEVFFNLYQWAFPTPDAYVTRARREAETIRELFPKAEIGVVVPHQPYQDDRFFTDECPNHMKHQREWVESLQGEDFYDAIIIHPYTPTGMPWNTKPEDLVSHLEGYASVTDHLEGRLDPNFDTLEKRFPGKDIWVTEYGIGGFGGAFKDYKLRSTHLGALHADLMLLRFLQRSSVTVAHWHAFSHFWNFVGGEQGISDDAHLTYAHFRLFDDPIRRNESIVPVQFTPRNPEVEAVALVGNSGGHLLIVNKRGNAVSLDGITAAQSRNSVAPTLRGAVQLTHRRDMPLKEASYDEEGSERVELTGDKLSVIKLPPYSFTRIAFSIR